MVKESAGGGGGQREMALPTTANVPEILCILTDMLFPNGASPRGQSFEMNFVKITFHLEIISQKNKPSKPRLYLLSKTKRSPYDQKNHSGTDDVKPHQLTSDSKQRDQLIQDCCAKDGDELMLYRPVFASTPNQECPNHRIQGPQDDSLNHDSEDI